MKNWDVYVSEFSNCGFHLGVVPGKDQADAMRVAERNFGGGLMVIERRDAEATQEEKDWEKFATGMGCNEGF